MQEHQAQWGVCAMARVLGVSRSAFYAWRRQCTCERVSQQRERDRIIRVEFQAHDQCYGAPRLVVELREQGHHCNVKTVAKSLQRQGLRAVAAKKFNVTTDSRHALPVYENVLNQDFSASAPNQKWVQDITYLWTAEGWLYLAVVIDLFSRQVVGWAMSPRIDAGLVCEALNAAISRRGSLKGVIVHSDRGSQYCSTAYREIINRRRFIGSMSGRGCCYDNACAESFFHSLKVELIHRYSFKTRRGMRQAVFQYIDVNYNTKAST